MLDMKTPFARSLSPLSHLVMPNPNEIISLSPAQLVQIQFKIFHSTEAEEREREEGEARPQRPSRLRSSCEKRPKKRKEEEEKEESKNN